METIGMMSETELSRPIRYGTLLISAPVLLSALAGAVLTLILPLMVEGQRTALAFFGFEVVVSVAAVLGVLVGLGRLRSSPAMALACIGGTILLGSALGWQGAGRSMAGISLMPLLGLRTVAALALVTMAAMTVLGREPRSWRPAITGGLLGVPVVICAALAVLPMGRRMLEQMSGEGGMLIAATGLLLAIVLGGLLAASVHLIVGAFDAAVGDDPR